MYGGAPAQAGERQRSPFLLTGERSALNYFTNERRSRHELAAETPGDFAATAALVGGQDASEPARDRSRVRADRGHSIAGGPAGGVVIPGIWART